MTDSFDLIDQPWIPCATLAGQVVTLSLRDTLAQSHTLRELGGETPLVTASLHRLLLAILHRVYGPGEEPDAWGALWERGQWEHAPLDAYFGAWRHRFDLFDSERPFYQCRHPAANDKSIISLLFEYASGNNPTLFDHSSERAGVALDPAAAARAVVAAQAFGLGGLSPVSGERFTDGPAARGITFFVQGETLFETLMLNLLNYPDTSIVGTRPERDCPAWEHPDPYTPLTRTPNGYLDYLTWQTRRVLLLPERGPGGVAVRKMLLGPGVRLAVSVRDPLKHYRLDKERGALVLRFNEERALWRDSAPLFAARGNQDVHPPEALNWLRQLMGEGIAGLKPSLTKRILALGMANDQAKVEFIRRETLPMPLTLLERPELGEHLSAALAEAEAVRSQLWGALSTLACEVLYHKHGQQLSQVQRGERDRLMESWGAERRYWAALEIPFHGLVAVLADDADAARRNWAVTLRDTAWGALNSAIAGLGDAPTALKAAVLARGQLGGGLRKALSTWFATRDREEESHA